MSDGAKASGTSDAGRIKRVRARAEATTARVVDTATAARSRSQTVDAAFRTYERDRRAVGGVLAGAIAFRLFVYLLPLVLSIVTLSGIVASFDPDGPKKLVRSGGFGSYIVNTVADATAQSKKGLWILVPLSLYGVYTGGTGFLKVLRAIHAIAWGEELTKMRRAVGAAFALFGVAVGMIAVVVLLQWVNKNSALVGLASILLTTAVYGAAWLLASMFLPHRDAPWTALLPGAVLVAVAVEVLHLVSVYFLSAKITSASELYGSLGVAAAMIGWLYLFGRLMVASAMLNATIWERNHPHESAPASNTRLMLGSRPAGELVSITLRG